MTDLDLAQLDAERHEQDRTIGRGYDYDATAPSHAEFLKRQGMESDDAGGSDNFNRAARTAKGEGR